MFAPTATNNYCIILDVSQPSSERESLLCCRACLTTDGRLFNIHDFKLADAFSYASGSPAVKDHLPQHLCSYCSTLVLKCASFRDMCTRTQEQLMTECLRGQLNTETIRRINEASPQLHKFTLTEVETVDCVPSITKTEATDDIQIKKTTLAQDIHDLVVPIVEDIHDVELQLVEDIKDEENINIVDINSILEVKLEEDTIPAKGKYKKMGERMIQTAMRKRGIKGDETEKNIKNESAFKSDIVLKIGSLKSETNIDKNDDICDDSINQGDESNLRIEDDHNMNNASDKQHLNGSVNRNKKGNIKQRDTVAKKGKKTVRELRKKNTKNTIEKINTFESDYSVRIFVLSKDEQQAEIAARKETLNYKGSDYKCQECYKGFIDKAAYENHMLRHNPSAGAYMCEICKMRFPKNYLLLKHLNNHKEKIVCTKCDFVSRTRAHAKDHYCLHAGKTFDCPHCGKSFVKRSSCLSHARVAHPALNVACDGCGEVFVSVVGLRLHKSKMHSKKIQCTICSAKFVSLAALNRHTDTAGEHADLRPCEQCGENCSSETELQEHVTKKHPKDHRCEKCAIAFPSLEAYSTHVARTHLQQRKVEGGRTPAAARKRVRIRSARAMCDQCGRMYPVQYMGIHRRSHEVKRYSCHHCSKAFSLKTNLNAHLQIHTGEKPFECPSCPLAFCRKYNLERHHRTTHLGIRDSYPCPTCDSVSTTMSSLRVHVDSKHGGKGWPKTTKRAKYNEAKDK